MKKKHFIIPIITACIPLFACNVNSNNTSTNSGNSNENANGSSTNSNNNGSSSTTNTSTTSTTIEMNETVASGVAPVSTLNSIDTSVLETSETQDVYQTSEDATLSGNYYNGVEITTAKNGSIELTLNNAVIYQNTTEGKALYNTNKKVSVTLNLPEGTTSYIYNNTDDTNALHIKGSLNITGKGKLVVISGTKSAIKCNGLIQVTDSTLELSAASYGIAGEEVEIINASVNVLYAGKDGIRAEVENEEVDEAPTFDSSIGYVNLTNTTYTASVEGDGIQANTTLTISGGETNITTQGSFVSYSSANIEEYELEDDDFKWSKSGSSYKKMSKDVVGTNYSRYYALVQSSKGLKVGALKYTLSTDASTELEVASTSYNLTITDGAIVNITSTDSASKVDYGDTTIEGGSQVTVNAGNKGFAPEHDFYLKGDDTVLTVTNSYEAVEAAHIYFEGGTAILSASDDGVNAASDYSTSDYSDLTINFDGSFVSVNAKGDGLDSNGSISFNAGTVLVLGPTSGADSAIDADSTISFAGAFVIAIGASGMTETQNFSATGSNYVIETTALSNTSSTNTLTISGNNESYTISVSQSFGEIVFASPSITSGSSYTFTLGTNTTTVTVSSNVTASSNGGQGGNPGQGGQGGNHGQGGQGGNPGQGGGSPR